MAYSDTNKVKFGISSLWFSTMESATTYKAPFANPGAVSASLEKAGDQIDFYADNIDYYSEEANDGYEGDIEVAKIVDKYYTEILGQSEDEDGNLVETINDIHHEFACGFEAKGDKVKVRFAFLRCSAGRPSIEASTTEGSNEPQTETISIKAMPVAEGEKAGVVRIKAVVEPTDTTPFEEWFKKVIGVTQG